jgi:flavin-dependent dehydrogenase
VGADGKEPVGAAGGATTGGPTGSGDGGAGLSGGAAGTSTAGNEDPRARKAKESDKSYAARMAKLDEETAKADEKAERNRVFLETFNAMTDEEKTAMFPTLTDEEKALIDGQGTTT